MGLAFLGYADLYDRWHTGRIVPLIKSFTNESDSGFTLRIIPIGQAE